MKTETQTDKAHADSSPSVGSAVETLVDLIEDPNNNGDYRLNVSGDDLSRLWRAIESAQLRLEWLEERYVPQQVRWTAENSYKKALKAYAPTRPNKLADGRKH